MVEGSCNGNGNKPRLIVINGMAGKEPSRKPEPPKKFPHLANEVEPLVEEALKTIRRGRDKDGRLIGFREKIRALRLLALTRDAVGGEVVPILREAALVADSFPDRLFAARLMIEVADAFREVRLDPWPVVDMAFACAQEAPDCREKEEALVDIARAYCMLGDFARAERIMENCITIFGLRQELKKIIEELILSVQQEE